MITVGLKNASLNVGEYGRASKLHVDFDLLGDLDNLGDLDSKSGGLLEVTARKDLHARRCNVDLGLVNSGALLGVTRGKQKRKLKKTEGEAG